MQISEKHFAEFKRLYKEEFEEEYNKMSEQELMDSAVKLVTLIKTVYEHPEVQQVRGH